MLENDIVELKPVYYLIETANKVGVSDSFEDVKALIDNQGVNGAIKVATFDSFENAAKVQRAILAREAIIAQIGLECFELPCVANECLLFDKPVAVEASNKLINPFFIAK